MDLFENEDPADLRRRLFRLGYMMLHQESAAEDVAQETVARAIEHASEFRRDSDLFQWTYSIAINLCRRRLNEQQRRASANDPALLDRIPAQRRGPATSAIMHEAFRRAAAAVAGLATPLREVFILHYIEDLPYDAVARICEISEGAARLRAMRARAELRQELRHMLEPDVLLRLDAEPVTPPT